MTRDTRILALRIALTLTALEFFGPALRDAPDGQPGEQGKGPGERGAARASA